MAECIRSSFGFEDCGARQVEARIDGGTINSDGGSLLLRETDRRLNLLSRLAEWFVDRRDPERVEHWVFEMLSQRIYGLRSAMRISTTTRIFGLIRCSACWLAEKI